MRLVRAYVAVNKHHRNVCVLHSMWAGRNVTGLTYSTDYRESNL